MLSHFGNICRYLHQSFDHVGNTKIGSQLGYLYNQVMEKELTQKTYYVFLGRFCPFHLGHQKTINAMIVRHGIDNIIVMIGSSNAYNSRTPYTYEDRKAMIKAVYPGILVIPIPDSNPSLIHFDGTGNSLWLAGIKKIESEMKAHFIFYGGSVEDLEVLSQSFETAILVERDQPENGISATRVRQALDTGDEVTLGLLLDPKVLPLTISGFTRFKST